MPATFDPTYDTELNAGNEAASLPSAPPVTLPDQFATEPQIQAAVGQLNAGQPVTALPRQDWSFQQAQAFNAKLDAFDQQAKAARVAADQAARDAAMLDQMSRVAKSSKDIAIALQQQDEIGFRNAVASGVPPVQALTRYPRAATSPMVALAKAASPTEMAPAPSVVNLPGMPAGVRSGLHGEHFAFPPGSEVSMPTPTVQKLPDGTEIMQVSPQHYQVVKKGGAQNKLPIDTAQEVAWRNADIKAAQAQRANLVKAGTRVDAPDIVKLDAAIEENKNAVRTLQKAASSGTSTNAAPVVAGKRVNVIGPAGPDGNPRRGTVPQGSKLPPGWQIAPQ